MSLKLTSFSTGPDGAAITQANSGNADDTTLAVYPSGGTIVYRAAGALTGPFCAEFTQASGTPSPVGVQISDTASALFTSRLYFRLSGAPPSDAAAFGIQLRSPADAYVARCFLTPTRVMRMAKTDGGTVATGTVAAPIGPWCWIEYRGSGLNTAATMMTASLYTEGQDTPLDTVTPPAPVLTVGLTDRIRYGRMGNGVMPTWWFDSIAQNIGSSDPLGPVSLGSDFVRRSGVWVPVTWHTRRSGAWV